LGIAEFAVARVPHNKAKVAARVPALIAVKMHAPIRHVARIADSSAERTIRKFALAKSTSQELRSLGALPKLCN
jgi:hypothetical protein